MYQRCILVELQGKTLNWIYENNVNMNLVLLLASK
jgi:hypothetical protein